MSLYNAFKPLLFSMDAETVHERALGLIERGLLSARPVSDPRLEVEVMGRKFRNPIGLAAGFDKNAVAVTQWPHFGFGFIEVGTVTALAQPGNPKPRLHRLPEDEALINRMGFNNAGAEAMAERLKGLDVPIPLGINLGKSKNTPLSEAPQDYAFSMRRLEAFGDYFVVNVSSPNTPGLRGLQEKGALGEILDALQTEKPVFVKLAPDLDTHGLAEALEVAVEKGVTGLIAANTTLSREGLKTRGPYPAGGLSGRPVRAKSLAALKFLAQEAPPEMILIGVGGLFDAEDVWERLEAGADLVQLYTGWVYGGPETVATILEGLLDKMDRLGLENLNTLTNHARRR